MILQAGMDAPHFKLPDADMQEFNSSAYLGKKNIVLYFYPKNDTPGCTMEANEFTRLDDNFAQLNTLVVGVSRDECLSHAAFRDKYGLSVLLLSDPESRVCKKYGVLYHKELEGGQTKLAIKRSTFIIDQNGKLRYAMYGVHAHGHAQEIYNFIKKKFIYHTN